MSITLAFNGLNCVYPDELKSADVPPFNKKSDRENQKYYQTISVLSSLCKVYEKMLCKQLNSFFETKLSTYLSGFHWWYSTQNPLSNPQINW